MTCVRQNVTDSGNDLVTDSTKTLPKPVQTKIAGHHQAPNEPIHPHQAKVITANDNCVDVFSYKNFLVLWLENSKKIPLGYGFLKYCRQHSYWNFSGFFPYNWNIWPDKI